MQRWARGGLIAALYVVLVFAFQFASFGPVQFRVAEALTLLPIVFPPEAIGGIYIGVLLANILSGFGPPWDIFGGSLISLVAAYLTYRYRHNWLAYAFPIILNAFWSASISVLCCRCPPRLTGQWFSQSAWAKPVLF